MRPLHVLLALAIILAGCADDTDSATDPAAGSQIADDTPLPVDGDGGIGDGTTGEEIPAEAPPFGVSSEVDSDVVQPFTSCWTDPSGTGLCADGIPDPDAVTLQANAQLVVTYVEGELTASWSEPGTDADPIQGADEQSALPVVEENPGIWLIDISGIPAGPHTVWLSWTGEPGDAFTAFTVQSGG